MNKRDLLQDILARINSRSASLADLTQIFEDYKSIVTDFAASRPEYRSALQHTPEEYPDLQRLIGRGHDAILKGRLIDSVRALKKKVEAIEPEEVAQPEASEKAQETPPSPEEVSDRERRVRNTPNLGME